MACSGSTQGRDAPTVKLGCGPGPPPYQSQFLWSAQVSDFFQGAWGRGRSKQQGRRVSLDPSTSKVVRLAQSGHAKENGADDEQEVDVDEFPRRKSYRGLAHPGEVLGKQKQTKRALHAREEEEEEEEEKPRDSTTKQYRSDNHTHHCCHKGDMIFSGAKWPEKCSSQQPREIQCIIPLLPTCATLQLNVTNTARMAREPRDLDFGYLVKAWVSYATALRWPAH
ncbi:hypothetical protein SODALDRAFT_356931 [Sodiomyces alkalinus F11]|uniref:Uncharacterized protein n=1 Tax=Sodiomyces alkalinus (strain CBS 110278 / VKM F-3762 / F11) TaxID=1314773 RepID=A0A3N2Q2F6_SODAK|nr:hypothetical protein SODALDRAFT_356931 [Sodiomyces alkalinus F11]ROT40912.1 hypothetical protein SODALDRAFT_356931 [Sodiomyces alkalinus F11]